MRQATVEVYQDKQGYWRWRLKARNRRVIAESGEGYSARYKATQAVGRLLAMCEDKSLAVACCNVILAEVAK